MLDPELKSKWIAALRSGDYRQARNVLVKLDDERAPAYCCLGVLEVVAGDCPISLERLERLAEATESLGWAPACGSGDEELYSPEIGLHRGLDLAVREELAELNDGQHTEVNGKFSNSGGKSFAEIADIIERDGRI